MALSDTWTDQRDGIDDASANIVNSIAHAVIDLEDDAITVDDEVSDSSTNPVQNKVIKGYVDAQTVTVDSAMSNSSTNPVQNKVVKEYIDNSTITVDNQMSDVSTNPVQNNVIKEYVDNAIYGLSEEYELIDKIIIGYSVLTSEPADWTTSFTNYYTRSGTGVNMTYVQISGDTAPEWESGKYYSYIDYDGTVAVTVTPLYSLSDTYDAIETLINCSTRAMSDVTITAYTGSSTRIHNSYLCSNTSTKEWSVIRTLTRGYYRTEYGGGGLLNNSTLNIVSGGSYRQTSNAEFINANKPITTIQYTANFKSGNILYVFGVKHKT